MPFRKKEDKKRKKTKGGRKIHVGYQEERLPSIVQQVCSTGIVRSKKDYKTMSLKKKRENDRMKQRKDEASLFMKKLSEWWWLWGVRESMLTKSSDKLTLERIVYL